MEIVLLEDLEISPQQLEEFASLLEKQGHTFKQYKRTADADAIARQIRHADAVITGSMPIPASAIEQAEKLQYIDVAFTGVDHIPLALCREKGIRISNASGYADESVAELCLAELILLMRKVPELEQACRGHQSKGSIIGSTLEGKTIGIVGAGKIGRRLAALLKAMNAHVIAYNRSPIQDENIDEQVDLKTLLQQSDAISLHVPLTDATRRMIGKEELECMKPTAYLINAARGPVVQSEALAKALNDGVIAGAAIDVFDTEPPLAADEPLLKAKNVIATPHIGYHSQQSMQRRAEIAFDNLAGWLEGTIKNEIKG